LLTIFYLYKVLCSSKFDYPTAGGVVNCLQFFIFTRFFAVVFQFAPNHFLLWIAYNFLSLQGSLQWNNPLLCSTCCCELLTIFYLYKVLCSQKKWKCSNTLLWIAYNFLSLQGSLQCSANSRFWALGCELLTIFYLYKVLCSFHLLYASWSTVVNCLQFFIFTRFFAVNRMFRWICKWLWIAYNFLSLQGSLQSILAVNWLKIGCELLTIFYLYKVLCSYYLYLSVFSSVVNCLQFFIFTRFFAVWITTELLYRWLWIAYNFLSLQGSLQLTHNRYEQRFVVNCLQFFIFTRFFAVVWFFECLKLRLWIAYNFLSLQGSLQLTCSFFFM